MTDPNPTPSGTESTPTTGPNAEELSEEPVNLDDVEPFDENPDEYDDLNEFVSAEWEAELTGRERVRELAALTTDPKTASEFAEAANTSRPTAVDALENLVEDGIVREEHTEEGKRFRRDPEWVHMKRARELATNSTETLETTLQQVEAEIAEYRERYGADSPEDLILDEETLSEEAWEDISEWRTADFDREMLRLAIQFKRVSNWSGGKHTESPSDSETGETVQSNTSA